MPPRPTTSSIRCPSRTLPGESSATRASLSGRDALRRTSAANACGPAYGREGPREELTMADTGVTQAQELDQAWVADLVRRWADAWNSHEHARVLDLVTEDVVYDDSAWPATMRGH